MSSMILVANGLIILLPLLLLTALAWFTLLAGFRRSDQPACRACKASLVKSGALLTQCPECDAPLGPKNVVFLGRTRPWPIWVITLLLTAPSALVMGIVIMLATGVMDTDRLVRTLNQEDTADRISVIEATGYETDELIAEMGTRPADSLIWSLLNERFEDAPPLVIQNLGKSYSTRPSGTTTTVMTEDQALDILSIFRKEFNQIKSSNLGMYLHHSVVAKIVDRLGYGHPKILELFEDHLLEPAGCPTVKYRKNFALTIDYANAPAAANFNILTHIRNQARPFSVATGIRIDGIEIKPRNERNRRVWTPGWSGRHKKTLYTRYLPPAVLEPGEHTLEIDLTNVVLPNGTPHNLPPEEWPAVVVRKDATLTCTFTIEDPNSPKPK